MAFVPVPATIKCSLFYTMQGIQAMNRIHVGVGSSLPTEADCATVAAAVANWWLSNCQALVPTTTSLRAVEAISIAEQNGPQATFSAGLPAAGTVISPALPNNVTVAVSLRTGLTGRSARGRWFWVGLSEGQVVENEVSAGPLASIVAAMDALIGVIDGLAADPLIISYVANGVPRPGGPVKFIITDALVVDSIVDSQRGRLH